jgi:hypothetical protein
MKYLIVKGWMGFGDRLQCLKMCVEYAQKYQLSIHVDWTDSIFSHGSESFYSYFDLKLPKFSLEDLDPELTVHPACWKDKLDQPITQEFLNTDPPGINLNKLDHPFDADIIVYSCTGYRSIYKNSKFFTDLFRVIHPELLQRIRSRMNIQDKIGVHLRGTDRLINFSKSHRFKGIRVRMVGLGLNSGQEFIAVSDDEELSRLWKANFSFPLLTAYTFTGNQGNHYKKDLSISKDSLNIDMLTDFFTLALCKDILSSSKDSRFAQEAGRLHPSIMDCL